MNVIDELTKCVMTINEGVTDGSFFVDTLKPYDHVICDMNSQSQLYERGLDSLGVSISSYQPYTEKTIEIKQMKGQPTDRVTLRDTGEFHASFYVTFESDCFFIDAQDWKTEKLVNKYGYQIFGLTPENKMEIASEYLQPDLINKFKQIIANG